MKLIALIKGLAWNTATTDELWKDPGTSGDDRGRATNALDEAFEAEAEWIKLCKYEEWKSGGSSVGRGMRQKFTPELAGKMVANFNSAVAKVLRFKRGAPIYIGHPDVDPGNYADKRRIGKIMELEARNDGLWGKPVWNKLGRENAEEGYHVFPSVTWAGKLVSGVLHPDFFISLGLTNDPAGDVEPTTHNAEAPGGVDALTEENQTNTIMLDPELIAALGLDEGASIEDALGQIEALKSAAAEVPAETEEAMNAITTERDGLKTDLASEKTKSETAQNALTAFNTKERDRLIGDALESSAITAAEKDGWEERFDTNHEVACNALAKVAPSGGLNTKQIDIGSRKVAMNSTRDRLGAVKAEVQRRMDANGTDHNAAWNSVKGDPEWAAVFEAMGKPADQKEEAA